MLFECVRRTSFELPTSTFEYISDEARASAACTRREAHPNNSETAERNNNGPQVSLADLVVVVVVIIATLSIGSGSGAEQDRTEQDVRSCLILRSLCRYYIMKAATTTTMNRELF